MPFHQGGWAPQSHTFVSEPEGPWATALDIIPKALFGLYSLSEQFKFKAEEAQLARDFQKTQSELAFARQMYVGHKNREALLEEQVLEFSKLPTQDRKPGGTDAILQMTAEGLFGLIEQDETYIDQLQDMRSQQMDGIKDAQAMQDRFSNIIEAGKDDAVQDYLISGALELDPETGEPVGSLEWAKILEKLKTGTKAEKLEYEKFREHAYISGIESSLRTLQEGKELELVDQQISVNTASIAAAEMQLTQGNYDMFSKILDRNDIVFGDIYKQQGLAIAAGINIGGLGLKDLQNMDTDDYADLMEEITEKYPSVTGDLSTFFNTIAVGGQLGVDVTESLTRAQSKAYEDFLQLNDMYEEIYENANPGASFNPAIAQHKEEVAQQIKDFHRGDKSYLEIKRLENKVTGYQAIGIYNTGIPRMERSFSVIQAHDNQENLRLSADAQEWEKVSKEGYPINLEVYEPKNMYEMPEEDWFNLQTSLAALKATTLDPANTEADLAAFLGQAETRKEEITAQKGTHRNVEEARESLSEAMFGSTYWGRPGVGGSGVGGRSPVMSWDIGELETQVRDRVRALSTQGKPDEVKAILDAWTSYQKYYTELTELYK